MGKIYTVLVFFSTIVMVLLTGVFNVSCSKSSDVVTPNATPQKYWHASLTLVKRVKQGRRPFLELDTTEVRQGNITLWFKVKGIKWGTNSTWVYFFYSKGTWQKPFIEPVGYITGNFYEKAVQAGNAREVRYDCKNDKFYYAIECEVKLWNWDGNAYKDVVGDGTILGLKFKINEEKTWDFDPTIIMYDIQVPRYDNCKPAPTNCDQYRLKTWKE